MSQAIKLKINPSPTNNSASSINNVSIQDSKLSGAKTTLKIVQKNNDKQEQQLMTQSNYSRFKDQRDHVYNIPDTYIGSSVQGEREERVLDLDTFLFKKSTIKIPEGVERLFIEILSNSGDNSARSLLQGIDPGEITVTMTETTIKIRNGGIPIPVEIHKEEKIYVPELIFGNLMSSSSYDKNKKRQFSSRNGFGAKLTNIFSKEFKIKIADSYNGLLYTQSWHNNMKVQDPQQITTYPKTNKAFVEIEYTMDFERFGYHQGVYPQEAYELFARHIVDTAFTLKIPVSFNGKKFTIATAKEYAKLYLGKEAVKNSILYYAWPEGTEVMVKKNVEFAKNKGVLPIIEICAVDTPDTAEKVAFVNNMWTRNGGVHYEAAFKAVASGVLKTVNDYNTNKKKKDPKTKLTLADVKKHVSLFINCWIEDPIFDSQSKNELKSPTPKVNIDEKILNSIMKWELVARLYAELDAKLFRSISKSDGKKKKFVGLEKLNDANKAASSESVDCTLYITEGDSALTYAMKMCSYIPNNVGPDYIGMFPIRGKLLNVMNAPQLQIAENKEIGELKKALGLREGVDYMDEENYKTLRYGHLMVCCDSDNDGKHILGLVMNYFHCKHPSLLARGYVKYLRTKILEVKKKGQKIKFYTQHEYDEWKAETPNYQEWEHSYFKGLGTSEDKDIEEESKDPKIVMTIYDEMTPYSMRLAFDKNLADNRKKWIQDWEPDFRVETMKMQPISSFINHEFIQFSIADLARSIPRFTDGMKTSQRKIIWTSINRWKEKAGKNAEKMKVAQFAASVSESTAYMHGETSLEGAIVGLAQNFVGSNNLPPFERKGEFGTRRKLGHDASAGRYIFTRPEIYFPLIYRKEDKPLLNIIIDEGKKIEPITLLPIIPMHLVNGVLGIGTGSSTFIPAHNPLDIVYWIESKIKGLPLPKLIPWYRGFNGDIELKTKENKQDNTSTEIEDDEQDPDEVLIDRKTKISMVTSGKFEEDGKKKIIITELPIGRSIQSYKVFLDKMREEKKITKYENYSTTDIPKFNIYGAKNPSLKSLKLIKSFGMSNMVLLDDSNRPIKYENAEMIMETFYSIRLAYYHKRKENILNNITDKIQVLNAKIEFILAVIKGYELIKENGKITDQEANSKGGILTIGRNKKDIAIQMERCGFEEEILKKVTLYNCTDEEVQISRDEIAKEENKRKATQDLLPEQIWLDDLSDFVKVYCKHYKVEYHSPKKVTIKVVNN